MTEYSEHLHPWASALEPTTGRLAKEGLGHHPFFRRDHIGQRLPECNALHLYRDAQWQESEYKMII